MDIINQYKQVNIEIIEAIKSDKEDIALFDKREEIVNLFLEISKNRDELKKMYKDQKLDVLDKKLEKTLKEKMSYVKEKIRKTSMNKQANLGYSSANRGTNFFSTKV